MAVNSKHIDDLLILEIDTGDKAKMEEVLKIWNFKDIQSFWRFSLSILLATENKGLWIQSNGQTRKIAPDDCLLNSNDHEEFILHLTYLFDMLSMEEASRLNKVRVCFSGLLLLMLRPYLSIFFRVLTLSKTLKTSQGKLLGRKRRKNAFKRYNKGEKL